MLLAVVRPSEAQQTKILTADKHNEYGLIYSLPITEFDVEVITERKVMKAGAFYPYAKKYLGTDDVVKEDHEEWTIREIKVLPYGVSDPEKQYLMQLKSGSVTYIAVSSDGMLQAINAQPENSGNVSSDTESGKKSGIELSDNEYLQYVGEDFLSATSSAKKAALLADELLEIRDARLSLTRGTAETMPADGRQLELMLASLERQEAALKAAFLGNAVTETVVKHFTFRPEPNARKILFRMSGFAGPVDSGNYSGEPVYVEVKVTEEPSLPVDAKGEEKKMPKDAVAYCIPGSAMISLVYKGQKLVEEEFQVAQFGMVFGLNPSLFSDKKEPSYAIFDPATGALLELGEVN